MATIEYTNGNIAKAIDWLVCESTPMPQRAWDAYHIIIRGDVRDGMEAEFEELDAIFGGVRHDEVATRVTIPEAVRGAKMMLRLYEATITAASSRIN